jgi:hypothetical protein
LLFFSGNDYEPHNHWNLYSSNNSSNDYCLNKYRPNDTTETSIRCKSPTSSFKDNIRANLENRNQHLNQQGNCMRNDGCATSDVGQGTLGNDNKITGFTDQSNNTTTANAATSGPIGPAGPAGAKGLKGNPGAPGARGAVGPAGPDKILSTREVAGSSTRIADFQTRNVVSLDCASDEAITGGGWQTTLTNPGNQGSPDA